MVRSLGNTGSDWTNFQATLLTHNGRRAASATDCAAFRSRGSGRKVVGFGRLIPCSAQRAALGVAQAIRKGMLAPFSR